MHGMAKLMAQSRTLDLAASGAATHSPDAALAAERWANEQFKNTMLGTQRVQRVTTLCGLLREQCAKMPADDVTRETVEKVLEAVERELAWVPPQQQDMPA
jgi:hypothetical protein